MKSIFRLGGYLWILEGTSHGTPGERLAPSWDVVCSRWMITFGSSGIYHSLYPMVRILVRFPCFAAISVLEEWSGLFDSKSECLAFDSDFLRLRNEQVFTDSPER